MMALVEHNWPVKRQGQGELVDHLSRIVTSRTLSVYTDVMDYRRLPGRGLKHPGGSVGATPRGCPGSQRHPRNPGEYRPRIRSTLQGSQP